MAGIYEDALRESLEGWSATTTEIAGPARGEERNDFVVDFDERRTN